MIKPSTAVPFDPVDSLAERILVSTEREIEEHYAVFPNAVTSPSEDTAFTPQSNPNDKPAINPIPSGGNIKIYKDRDGNWCVGDRHVTFSFTNRDWFVSGFGAQTQLIGLLIGDKEYRITLSGGGMIYGVHVRNKLGKELPLSNNELCPVDSFEIPLDHTTIPFFKPGRRSAAL